MEAIRKFIKVNGDTIRLEELKTWQDKQVEVIILPAAESDKMAVHGYGVLKGQIEMAEDFDAPLEDFKEYMP